jgi:hypothetical protein
MRGVLESPQDPLPDFVAGKVMDFRKAIVFVVICLWLITTFILSPSTQSI